MKCLLAAWLFLLPTAAWADNDCLEDTEREQGFVCLFDGKTTAGWVGGYTAKDGVLVCEKGKGGGKFYTEREFSNFIFRFEFKLTPGGNNGVGIRMPPEGDAAYNAMEIQILDDTAKQYKSLKPYQYCCSIYGVVPAQTGHLNPVGEWNKEEILADGPKIRIILNDFAVVDADLSKIDKTVDGKAHPGLHREKGHIGFLGHGSNIQFRNIRIKTLPDNPPKQH